MSLKTWRNGDEAEIVQKIIEYNFRVLGRYLSSSMLCLSSSERKVLSSDYLREGLLIYDTTEDVWYKYTSGFWEKCSINSNATGSGYSRNISKTDWLGNTINIDFATHLALNPIVQLFIKDGNSYSPVIGGIEVDNNYNIILSTDLPFDGKVVVK